nr:killer cell immunoglobulin-like receptor [Pan troglodytes]
MSLMVVSMACVGLFLLQGAWPHEGVHRKLSLLAYPGPLVKSEEAVILQCWSDVMFEHFLLHREGKFNDTLRLTGGLHDGVSKANFSIGHMTQDLAGTYRCYGSLTHSPYLLSAPSDPLDIVITGNPSNSWPSPTEPSSKTGNPRHLHLLIGTSVAIILFIPLLLFLLHRWCSNKKMLL